MSDETPESSEPMDDSDLTGIRSGPPPGAPAGSNCPECGGPKRGRGYSHTDECKLKGKPRAGGVPAGPTISESSVANAWLGLWVVIRLVAKWFDYEEIPPGLTEEEAAKDAQSLTPVVRRFPLLINVLGWIAAPVIIFRRLSEKFRRKPREKKEPAVRPVG